MGKTNELDVRVIKIGGEDYVCFTDMAKLKSDDAQQTISNWMRNRMTLEYLGLWEELYNPDFKHLGFEGFRMENINAVMINENAPQKRLAFRRVAAQRALRASARALRSGHKEPRVPQPQRLKKLNEIAIQQMRILSEADNRKYLK